MGQTAQKTPILKDFLPDFFFRLQGRLQPCFTQFKRFRVRLRCSGGSEGTLERVTCQTQRWVKCAEKNVRKSRFSVNF